VTQDPTIRFYAGAPLRLRYGSHIGTLRLIDDQPRELDSRQQDILQHLSAVVVKALESRQASQALAASEAQFRALTLVMQHHWAFSALMPAAVAGRVPTQPHRGHRISGT